MYGVFQSYAATDVEIPAAVHLISNYHNLIKTTEIRSATQDADSLCSVLNLASW